MADVIPGTANEAVRNVADGHETFVPIVQLGGSAAVTGPLTNAQLTAITGTAAQTTVATNPAAAGLTELALLRGILAELQAQTALLQTIATNTTPAA